MEQSRNLVLNQLLAGELDHINLYIANETKSGQNGHKFGNAAPILYTFNENTVFIIDDDPFAGWAHPCRYGLMSSETSEVQTINQEFFPSELIVGFSVFSPIPFNESIPLTPDPNN